MKQIYNIGKIVLGLVIVGVVAYIAYNIFSSNKVTSLTQNFTTTQVRGLAYLVLYEQDYTLDQTETQANTHLGIHFSETIKSSATGRMAFHINLGDTVNTTFVDRGDVIEIRGPLVLTFNEIDPASISMVKSASFDPTLEVSQDSVLKRLGLKALETYVPASLAAMKSKGFGEQEKILSKLMGKPVRLIVDMEHPIIRGYKG
jgi:hypothetical protein